MASLGDMGATRNTVHLYFHSACFDGAASGALAITYFKQVRGYSRVVLHAVGYDLRGRWLATRLKHPCAIVDFLYHPVADFWADHHSTAFLNDDMRRHYENRGGSDIFYDAHASSCAVLLWRRLGAAIPAPPAHYEELVQWADRVDSARYESVEQALSFNAPALRINLALAVAGTKAFSQHLVRLFSRHALEDVATMSEIRAEFRKGLALHRRGLRRLQKAVHQTADGIAVFDVDGQGVLVNRYAPFCFYPRARYSAGIVSIGDKAKITAMRNPWIEFQCAPLGELCSSLGGGGHQRVGSVWVETRNRQEVLSKLLNGIAAWERAAGREATL